MKRIIGVNSNCYHGYSIEEALEGIHKAGFHYVELTATKGWTEHVFPTQTFSYLLGLKKKMQELSIIPFALSGHCNLMDRERMKDFAENIELARFFGCQYIVSSVGEAHLEDKETAGNDILAANIKSVIPLLEDADMTLVLEIHGAHCNGKILKEIVDLIGSDHVRINYDTANAIFYGGVKPEEDMQNCKDEIAYMHLKDKRGGQKEWDFPALGKGTVNFPKIFENLENNKNACPFSIEIEFTKEGPKDIAEVDQAVLDSYQYLKEKGFEI